MQEICEYNEAENLRGNLCVCLLLMCVIESVCVCVCNKEQIKYREKERVIDRQMINTENDREIKKDKES